MTERETLDTFARQVAQVLQRLEAEQTGRDSTGGDEDALRNVCPSKP
jgi:GAF domain-containing protein